MSFIYLATPYSKYKDGLEAANAMASRHAADFLRLKFPVFCPIAHSHSIAVHGGLTAKDHSIWMPLDFAFCEAAFALVVATEDGWEQSYGVGMEIKFFKEMNKPIYFWSPADKLVTHYQLIADLERDWECHKQKVMFEKQKQSWARQTMD